MDRRLEGGAKFEMDRRFEAGQKVRRIEDLEGRQQLRWIEKLRGGQKLRWARTFEAPVQIWGGGAANLFQGRGNFARAGRLNFSAG